MSENIISWTPCKVKYPPEEGSYFVTVKHLHTNLVAISRFPHDDWARRDIIAWAELPKPYDKRRTKNVEIDWHLYPEEKPDTLKCYLATKMVGRKRIVSTACRVPLTDMFFMEEDFPVIAWAEMPEPYVE